MQAIRYLLLFLCVQLASSRHVYFYRRDYTYIREFDAFYKLHLDANATNWNYAFLTCDDEGSKLFYPKEEGEVSVVKELMDKLDEALNTTEVFIGVHNQFHIGEFVTVDGEPLPSFIGNKIKLGESSDNCVVLDSTDYKLKSCSGLSQILFVCKREDKKLCPTIDPDYKYYEKSNKCYKINNKAEKWEEAMQTCFMEGGFLAIVDKNMQTNDFHNLLNMKSDKDYYIGIREMFQTGNYYTVKGTKFEDELPKDSTVNNNTPIPRLMSQQRYRGAYNYFQDEIGEHTTVMPQSCGALMRDSYNQNSQIKATSCDKKLPFICEVNSETYAIN